MGRETKLVVEQGSVSAGSPQWLSGIPNWLSRRVAYWKGMKCGCQGGWHMGKE